MQPCLPSRRPFEDIEGIFDTVRQENVAAGHKLVNVGATIEDGKFPMPQSAETRIRYPRNLRKGQGDEAQEIRGSGDVRDGK